MFVALILSLVVNAIAIVYWIAWYQAARALQELDVLRKETIHLQEQAMEHRDASIKALESSVEALDGSMRSIEAAILATEQMAKVREDVAIRQIGIIADTIRSLHAPGRRDHVEPPKAEA